MTSGVPLASDEVSGLYIALRPRLVAHAALWGGGHWSEDIVQEAFLALVIEGSGGIPPEAWLHTRVKWRARAVYRRQNRHFSFVDDRDPDEPREVEFPDPAPGPDQTAQQMEVVERVQFCLAGLTLEQKAQLDRYVEGQVPRKRVARLLTSAGKALVAVRR